MRWPQLGDVCIRCEVTQCTDIVRGFGKTVPYTICGSCKDISMRKTLSTLNGYLKNVTFAMARCRCKNTGRLIEIGLDDVESLWSSQQGICALTGLPMLHSRQLEHRSRSGLYNTSLDRLDSNGNYTKENVQLVCSYVNLMKGTLSQDTFWTMCSAASSHQEAELDARPLPSLALETPQPKMCSCESGRCRKCLQRGRTRRYLNQRKGHLQKAWVAMQRRSRKRNTVNELTASNLEDLWQEQRGLCALSGYPLLHCHDEDNLAMSALFNASVDRIDSALGYIAGNVQLVGTRMNLMKGDKSNSEFWSFCSKVTEQHKRYAKERALLLLRWKIE
jgi:hypothetical protein